MAINFPSNPNINDTYEVAGKIFSWDGEKWINITPFSGEIKTDIIPSENEQFDLGSDSNKFKDLYLSGNSIFLGDVVLEGDQETLKVRGKNQQSNQAKSILTSGNFNTNNYPEFIGATGPQGIKGDTGNTGAQGPKDQKGILDQLDQKVILDQLDHKEILGLQDHKERQDL